MTLNDFQYKWLRRMDIDGQPYTPPSSVFKYMSQKYIDKFFETGELKLGTFNLFKKIEDGSRADYQEGTHEYCVWNKNRSHKKTLRRFTGKFNYIFCTSATENLDLLGSKFNVDGYFKITNPLGFGYEIAQSIEGFSEGMEGPAIYTESGQTNIYTDKFPAPDFDETTPMSHLFKTFDLISKVNFDLYFSKRNLPFNIENEYRFLWLLKHEAKEEDLIIKCPNALRFCEKIT